eukprot:3872893-Amphidinium_carterae.1
MPTSLTSMPNSLTSVPKPWTSVPASLTSMPKTLTSIGLNLGGLRPMPKFLTSVPKTLISVIGQDSYILNCGSSDSSKPHWQDSHQSHQPSDGLPNILSEAGTTVANCCMALTLNQMIQAMQQEIDVLDSELTIIESIPETVPQRCRDEGTRPFLLRQSDLQTMGCVVPYVRRKIMKGPDAHLHLICVELQNKVATMWQVSRKTSTINIG